ncbi:OmpH family outer membrane protein [Geobacter sp. FeAm09]|uniref:OmpH family outer membrane protein n=1 Tax=Geobacter sp. FeAm09 TaxID=2597769 RepID=UPI00143D67A2|nr:OmpH family outer membrane protein [Geobacter sp. FeAm09]
MTTLLKTLLVAALAASLPGLAAAADPTPADTKPAVAAPAPTTPATTAPEKKPSDGATARQSTKLGSVDLTRIGDETAQGKAVQAKLQEKKDKLQTRIDGKRKQLDKLRAGIQAKLPSLSPAQRAAKEKEFQKKVEEFQKLGKQLEEELFSLQEKETKALYDETERAAAAYGKANGFAVIIIKKQLLYVGSDVDAQDVTDALIAAMDAAAKKK